MTTGEEILNQWEWPSELEQPLMDVAQAIDAALEKNDGVNRMLMGKIGELRERENTVHNSALEEAAKQVISNGEIFHMDHAERIRALKREDTK